MSKVIPLHSSNYSKVIHHRPVSGKPAEFTINVFNPDTVITEFDELPNIAYRLYNDEPDTTLVIMRLDIHDPKWYDKANYTTLKHTLADLLIRHDIDIGSSEYPNGLLEYIVSTRVAVTMDLTMDTIHYTRGFYKWTFQPVSQPKDLDYYTNKSITLFALHSNATERDPRHYMLVDDTSSAWSSFLATSYPKWFVNKHEYLKALCKAFTTDVKGTALEGVSFTC